MQIGHQGAWAGTAYLDRLATKYGRAPPCRYLYYIKPPLQAIPPGGGGGLETFGLSTGNKSPHRGEPLEKLGREGQYSLTPPLPMACLRWDALLHLHGGGGLGGTPIVNPTPWAPTLPPIQGGPGEGIYLHNPPAPSMGPVGWCTQGGGG